MAEDNNSKKTNWYKLIILLVIVAAFGAAMVFLVRNWQLRGTSQVTATVRLADGTTEDEIVIAPTKIAKVVRADRVIFNKADYIVGSVTLADGGAAVFGDCTLSGIYEPEKCSDLEGTSYWVTLTAIE